jgi:hypothetical protein
MNTATDEDVKDARRFRFLAKQDCTMEYCDYTSDRINGRPHESLSVIIDQKIEEEKSNE